MANQSPAYLMYPDDILASGRVNSLTAMEELWYRRAIDYGWKNEGMPSDPKEFAGWVGRECTAEAAEKIIAKFYTPHKKDPSKVINERQEKERKLFLQKRKQKSEAGKRGMAKRWNNKSNTDNSVITEHNIPIPIPIPKKEEEKHISAVAKSSRKKQELRPIPDGFELTPEMREWIAGKYPRLNAEKEFEKFKERCKAKGTEYKDWESGWRSQMMKADEWLTSPAPQSQANGASEFSPHSMRKYRPANEKVIYVD